MNGQEHLPAKLGRRLSRKCLTQTINSHVLQRYGFNLDQNMHRILTVTQLLPPKNNAIQLLTSSPASFAPVNCYESHQSNRLFQKEFKHGEYAFSEFTTQSCVSKSYVCCVSPKNLAHWLETRIAIWYHNSMCFLLLDFWFIIKTKVIVQKLDCEKIFHIKLYGQTLNGKI